MRRWRTIEDNYVRFYQESQRYKSLCDDMAISLFTLPSKDISPNHTQIAGGSRLQLKHYIGPSTIAACSIVIVLVVLLGENVVQIMRKRRDKSFLTYDSDVSFYH